MPNPVSPSAPDSAGDSAPPRRVSSAPIQYKGEDLEAGRGPGLGCFRFQLVILAIVIVLTPVSVVLGWPYEVSAGLLFVTLLLLLFAGQTIIFLLRLVAAERRGRRRPLAARTPTVGQLEDEAHSDAAGSAPDAADSASDASGPASGPALDSADGSPTPDLVDPAPGG